MKQIGQKKTKLPLNNNDNSTRIKFASASAKRKKILRRVGNDLHITVMKINWKSSDGDYRNNGLIEWRRKWNRDELEIDRKK